MEEGRFIFNVEDVRIGVELLPRTVKKIQERGITKYQCYALVLRLGKRLIDMDDMEEFIVTSIEEAMAIVCRVKVGEGILFVDVVMVVDIDKIFVAKGFKTYKLLDI